MSYIELSPEDPEEVLLPNYERAGDGGQSIFGRIRRAASKVSRRPKVKTRADLLSIGGESDEKGRF